MTNYEILLKYQRDDARERIEELEGDFFDHLVYLHDHYPDVYQDPEIPAFEDYESEGDSDE